MKSMLCDLHCKPCEGGVAPLSPDEARAQMEQIGEWKLAEDSASISRDFSFKGFLSVMNFVNAVAYIANREGHHPDVAFGYNYCRLVFTTHAISGLSQNDFICAAKIDALLK